MSPFFIQKSRIREWQEGGIEKGLIGLLHYVKVAGKIHLHLNFRYRRNNVLV